MARALRRLGKEACLVTDARCARGVGAASRALDSDLIVYIGEDASLFEKIESDLLVFIERPGRAADGCYYNMRGEDISETTAPLDGMALAAQEKGVPVLAVGDGGNEAGMGTLYEELLRLLPEYAKSLSVVRADVVLAVDVSNWGGYALSALLSARAGAWLGQTEAEERALFAALLEAGAVDGLSGRPELSADGFDLDVHVELVRKLMSLVDSTLLAGENG